MKNIKTILVLALVSLLCMFGRGENSNKQKELEQTTGKLSQNKKALENQKDEPNKENLILPSETKKLVMIFEDYSEGDFPHLIFIDISSKEEYDFRFLSDNNLSGAPILLEDNDAAFGFKANPDYLKKTFNVEIKKIAVVDSDLDGKTFKSMEWVITSLELK
jgi:hypothetical protein